MQIYDVVLIPLIIGLIELFKVFKLPKKLLPLVSIALGIIVGIVYVYPHDVKGGVLVGIMMGLSASGMYSGGKTLVERNDRDESDC